MDPWNTNSIVEVVNKSNCQISHSFEDNFDPKTSKFVALEDSELYLAALERKLNKLRKDASILQQLKEKREICLENLLNSQGNYNNESDLELEVPVRKEFGSTSELIRHINPAQPLSVGEVVHLVKYDFLDIKEEEELKGSDFEDNASR